MDNIDDDFEIEVNIPDVPFDNGENYMVGYDTIGDGVRFDTHCIVCSTQEELNDEVTRVINEHDLYLSNENWFKTLEEVIVILKIMDFKINYKEYTIIKTKELKYSQ